ncbi:MAG TPA: radical SAM protein [Bacteroidia bacterium]|nr:radical SAM protein [Bacteroidia bacterium]
MLKKGQKIFFLIPPTKRHIIRDYAGGLGFELTEKVEEAYFLPPLDFLQLAASVSDDFIVSVVDAEVENFSQQNILALLATEKVDAIIIKISFPTFESDLSFAKEIKTIVPLVIVKIETFNKEILTRILSEGKISFCIVTECEDNLVDILLNGDKKGTAYLINDNLKVVFKDLIENLDTLPFPKRNFLKSKNYYYPKLGKCTTILSSRGCPYSCGYYCPYPLTQGEKWRSKSVDKVIAEIQEILSSGIDTILFRDAVFSFDVERAVAICDEIIAKRLDIKWWCETRADRLPDKLINKMVLAGCKGVNIGVESGDSHLRHSHLKRGISDEKLQDICSNSKEAGLTVAFLLMVGYPGENRKSILSTAKLLLNCRPDYIGINFPVAYPGTTLESDAIKNGWIKDAISFENFDGSKPLLETHNLSKSEMIESKQMLLNLFIKIKDGCQIEIQMALLQISNWASK